MKIFLRDIKSGILVISAESIDNGGLQSRLTRKCEENETWSPFCALFFPAVFVFNELCEKPEIMLILLAVWERFHSARKYVIKSHA